MKRLSSDFFKNKLIAAPLAGFSNVVFREIAIDNGADLCYTEMISDHALIYNSKDTIKLLERAKNERYLIAQLFGYEEESMVKAAKIIEESGADIIDINCGCPVPKVFKKNGGASMMKDIGYASKIIKAIIDTVDIPVTVKMRLGISKEKENYIEFAKEMERIGVSALAIHARYRSDFYSGSADYNKIKILKESVSIPVVGNGDVCSVADYLKMKETGVDSVMLGRGCLGNPFIFNEIKTGKKANLKDIIETCRRHIHDLASNYDRRGLLLGRALSTRYIKGIANANTYKTRLVQVKTLEEYDKILDEILASEREE